jgi:uncharacterized membrane protein
MTTQYHTINLVVTLVVRATLSHYRTASAISQEMTIPLFLIHNVIHWLTAGHLWNPMHQFAHLIERGRRARNQAQWKKERGELDLCTLKHSLDCRCSRTIAPEGWVLSSVE